MSFRVYEGSEVKAILQYLSSLRKPSKTSESKHTRSIPAWVKKYVFERDGGKCVACSTVNDLHFDHIIPYAKGGASNNPQNIQLLCEGCNLRKQQSFLY